MLSLLSATFRDYKRSTLGDGINVTNVRNIFLIDCYFIGNKGTALTVQSSTFHTQGNLKFINNSAFHKGALAFVDDSYMVLNNNSHIVFQDKKSTHVGGASYVEKLSQLCFILLSKVTSLSPLRYENATIHFINNTSVNGGDDV